MVWIFDFVIFILSMDTDKDKINKVQDNNGLKIGIIHDPFND